MTVDREFLKAKVHYFFEHRTDEPLIEALCQFMVQEINWALHLQRTEIDEQIKLAKLPDAPRLIREYEEMRRKAQRALEENVRLKNALESITGSDEA